MMLVLKIALGVVLGLVLAFVACTAVVGEGVDRALEEADRSVQAALSTGATGPTGSTGGDDARACELLRSAKAVPPGSERWNERLLDALDFTVSDEFYSAVDRLYWILDDQRSIERLDEVLAEFC